MNYLDEAVKKLEEGQKEKCGQYGDAMKKDVAAALRSFCEQDGEFAQAVAQGGRFKDCMAAVAKKVTGGSISDMTAFGEAVKFYFPGAGIDVKMTINLCASVERPKEKGIVIDLTDYF